MEQYCAYYNEPILDTETGTVFNDMYTWMKSTKDANYYKLIMEDDYRYKFVNEDKLEYPLGDGTIPPRASIKDVHTHKADAFVLV